MSASRTQVKERTDRPLARRAPAEADAIGPAREQSLAERYREMAHEGHEHRGVDTALRALDLAIAGLALLVLSPVLVAIALSIRLTSGSPVLYRGRRVGPRGAHLHDAQVPHAHPGRRGPARPVPRPRAHAAHAVRGHAARPGAALRAPRRDAAALERDPRRHERRRAAADPARVLRGAVRPDPAVLAAPRRGARADRLRPAAHDPRDVVGGEARARPGVRRRPLRAPVPARVRGDRVAHPHEPGARRRPARSRPA